MLGQMDSRIESATMMLDKNMAKISQNSVLLKAVMVFLAVFLFTSRVSAESLYNGAAATSPRAMCQSYINLSIGSIERNTENDCLIRVGDNNAGFGYVHAYYTKTPAEFCIASSGPYFPKPETNCWPISSAGKTPPQGDSGKLVTPPSFQIKELQYDTLPTGKQITAGDKERIEITMPDGSLIQLDANATFTPVSDHEVQSVFGRYRYLWQPFHDGKCIVGQNLVRQNCRKVITRDAIIGDRDTEFLVETDQSGTTVTVLEGLLGVADLGGKKTVEVAGGQFTYIKHNGLPDDSQSFDPAKIDRWWEKKTMEQTAKILALAITGFIFLVFILSLIRQRILGKDKLASGQRQPAKTMQLILLIIMLGVIVVYALSVMGYITLPKINLQ